MTIDEPSLLGRLSRLNPRRRCAFAAACAERTLPAFSRYTAATGEGDVEALRAALDLAWASQTDSGHDLASKLKMVEEQIPDEDGSWVFETGYAQNAAAGVAYALRSCLSGDSYDGVWAARQLLELAEHATQRVHDLEVESAVAAVRTSNLVEDVVASILADLDAIEAPVMELSQLRLRAHEEGVALSLRLP